MKIVVHGLKYPDVLSDYIAPQDFIDVVCDARVTEVGAVELTTEADDWEKDSLRKMILEALRENGREPLDAVVIEFPS